MSEAPPIQPAAFAALLHDLGDDPAFLVELFDVYFRSAQRLTARMREVLGTGRPVDLAHQAHELKGISAQLGADRLPKLCAELEVCVRQGSFEDADERVREIEIEAARVEVALRTLAAQQ